MSTSDDRKVKRKKQKKGSVAKTHFQNQATCQNFAGSIDLSNSPTRDILSPGLDSETMKKLEKLMDAKDDSELPQILLSRGPNPYLERCLLCGCERKDSGQTEDFFNDLESSEKKSTDSNSLAQLPLWVCSDCRKSTDQGFDRKVNLDSFMDPDLPPEPAALPFLDPGLESEPSSPSGSVCNCEACTERRQIEEDHDRETQELQNCWTELRKLVRVLYGRREGDITHEEDDIPDEEKAKELVHRLCARDPHQLFLRLESQVREFVIEMKVKLLKQLNSGYKTPPEAKAFIQLLLDEYGHLCTVARKIAEILNKLKTDHLAKFNVTWELHNKHLFQSIAYTEPSIQSSLHLIISQLRLGAASKESYNEDTYPNLLHRYLKFDDEMSVISVVWRDSHQLIEQYNEEQAALKLKQKMLKEDWEFFKAQRKILEEQVSKNTKTPISHSFEAQFTETMRLMLQGSKPGPEECHCPRCNRKRCPCDECTITHMITCGLINTDALEACHNSKHPNFLHDPNRYRIDVSPPSMSSTTSSSGSSSPLMVDHERLTMPFDECQLGQNEDIPEEIEENCQSQNGKDEEEDEDDDDDIEDDEEDDDEDDDEEDDEDDDYDLDDGDDEDDEEEEEEDDLEDDLTDKIKLNEPQKSSQNIDTQSLPSDPDDDGAADLISSEKCDCYHCVSQAQAEQMIKLEENTCQCYACLREHGKTVSTSLPQQVTTETSRPAELNLYPHIHGSAGLHGLTNHHVRPLLPTQLYDLHLPIRQPKPLLQSPSKVPLKLDFDSPEGIHEHIYHAYGEWDNTYDARMLLPKYSNLGSELLPPAPLTSNFSTANFLSEPFSVATQTVGDTISTSTPTTSAFKTSISSHVSMTTVQVKEDVNKDNIVPKTKSSDVSNNTKNMSPPCTRPVTLGGNISQQKQTTSGGGVEKQHATHCKRHNPSLLGKNVINLQSHTHTENNSSNLPVKVTQDFIQTAARNIRENAKEGMQMIRQFANSLNANVNNSHSCNHSSRTTPNHLHQQNGSTDHNHASGCPNTMSLPTSVNNVSVGTTTGCLEQDFDGHYDDNCDSVDDSCSEQSSSASNSNQKEGKYCDCCYCEFFGHGNPPVAPTSKNYAEMRDRLRLRLKKKNEAKQEPHHHKENCIAINNHNNRLRDPVETQGLDELIKFINGTESKKEQEKSSKAAKRARQKQRKAEEKARLEAEKLRKEQEKAERERERALNAANKEKETKSARKKRKKEQEFISERQPDLNLIREPPAGKEDDRDTSAKNVKLKNNSTGKNSHSNSPQPVGKVKEESTGQRSAPKISQKNSLHCDSKENKHCTLPHNSSEVKKILSSPCNSPKFGKVKTNTEVAVKSSPVEKRKMCGDTVKEVPKSHTKVNIMDIVHDKILNEDADQLNKKSKKQQLSAGQKHFNNHLPSTPPQNQVQSAHRSQQQSSKLPPPPPPQSPRQQTLVQTKQPLPQQTSRQQQNQNIPRQQSPRQNISQSPRQQVSQLSVRQQATVNSRQPMPVSARQQQVKVQQPSSPRQPQLLKSQPSVSRQQQLQFKDLPVQQNGTPVDPPIPKYTQNITQNGTTDVFKQPGPVNKVEKSTPEDKKSGKVKKPDDTSPQEQVKSNRNKKNKKKNRNSEDLSVIDEIFMPKSESDLENGEMDEVEKELEEFKRFCLDSTPVKREKLQVNMNLKDIFVKKKSGLGCS